MDTVFCGTCLGEFDAAEWETSPTCPECESQKWTISRANRELISDEEFVEALATPPSPSPDMDKGMKSER